MIKYISVEVNSEKVQEVLNYYARYILPESLSIVSHGVYDNTIIYCQVTFMLSQTFNSKEELDSTLAKGDIF